MAYPPHVLLSWGGSLHGVEIWSNSLRLEPNASQTLSEDDLDAFLAELVPDLNAFHSQTFFHTGSKLEYVKANRIGPDGRYLSTTTSHTLFLGTPIVGTGGDAHPAQVSCVATLMTNAQRGLANKGRLYFGGLARSAFTVDPANGLIPVAQRDAFALHVKNFLNNINNAPGLDAAGPGMDASVISPGAGARPGIARKVSGVRVGRVLDTQRRRRNALPESYSAVLPVA
jgi:hypothetical protein